MIKAFNVSWPSFRRALIYACIFFVSSSALFIFIYLQAANDEIRRIKALLESQVSALSVYLPDQASPQPGDQSYNESFRLTASGLFESDGTYLSGSLREIPRELPIDGKSHLIEGVKTGGAGVERSRIIMAATHLPNGRVLVIARNAIRLVNLEETVKKALVLGVLPLSLISIITGFVFSQLMSRRLRTAQQCLNDLKEGRLDRRLPVSVANDELDQLAAAVNEMLSELEAAVHEVRHVGNNIAHDLRTPLSRVRAHLEHAQSCEDVPQDAQALIESAISGLDQTLAITTAMLRLVQLEAGRTGALGNVDLAEILHEVAELYGPLAEHKDVSIDVFIQSERVAVADKDLLMEAIANIVDNAVKFTRSGGKIRLMLLDSAQGAIVKIEDSGPGIPQEHRNDVFKRFFRCNQSRDIPGTGLGLTLVAAILKMHGFHIEIRDGGPGCIIEIRCFRDAAMSPARR